MKMSEVFKLPLLWEKDGGVIGEGFLTDEEQKAKAIIEAVNSHDTLTTELEVAVDALRPFAKFWEKWLSGELQKKGIVADPNWETAHKIVAKHGSK